MRGSIRKIFERHSYDLRDKFNDDRAAGAVNGTLATDGVNTRTVTDTDSKLTISDGALNLAPHTVPAHGDPGLWYPAQTRVPGLVGVCALTSTDVTVQSYWGFDTDQSSYPYIRFVLSGDNILAGWFDSGRVVGSALDNTEYTSAIAVRATGFYCFVVRGGSWTLLWPDVRGNNTPLYPSIGVFTATIAGGEIAIRATRWLPTPLLSDGFGDAGALVTSDGLGHAEGVAGGLGRGGGGRAWTAQIGTWANAANVCGATALVGGIAIATAASSKIDVLHNAEITRAAGNVGVVVRYADAANYVYAHHTGANAVLTKRVAGAETVLINIAAAYGAGRVLQVVADGTLFDLYYNNVKIGTTQTILDAALQTSDAHGLYTSNVNNTFDDAQTWMRSGYSVPA